MKRILTIALTVVLLIVSLILLGVRSSDRDNTSMQQSDPTNQSSTAGQSQTTQPGTTVQTVLTDPNEPTQTDPTVTEPPVTEPPVTEPPATEPPVTEPPVTEPPATDPPATEPEEEVTTQAESYFIYDCQQEQYLSESADPSLRVYPASITKLFTAYVALQHLDPATVVTAGDELSMMQPDSSIAYIRPGHKLTVDMLVEGMLLPSGNDAAYVLAAAAGRALGGASLSAEEAVTLFMEEVNRQAAALGMTGTHFVTPDGDHHPDHYTTHADLVIVAKLALENTVIRRYVGTCYASVVYASGQTNTWHNTNKLIDKDSGYYCPAAIGLKTGSTDAAGYCLLSAFDTGDRILLIGYFGGTTKNARFTQSLKLYEAALDMLT